MARTVNRSDGAPRRGYALRWVASAVVLVHGLLHLLGAAKGLGWAEVAQLEQPISAAMGVGWLAVAVLVVAAGVGLAVAVPRWWLLAGVAALASQAVLLTAFDAAAAGTVANVLILLAALHGYASQVDAPVTWQLLDERRVRGAYTTGVHTVTAELVFNDEDELVDFVSDDRLTASPDGETFTHRRWSTPLRPMRQPAS